MELPFFTSGGGGGGSSSSAATRAEALRWLAIGEKLLAGRDLVGSKSFAARARESDPTLLYADQIIAVADTLLAGDKRINNLNDWYAVLQLAPHQYRDPELIAGQYRKLALLLNPQKNKLPFSDQAFNLVVTAWQVLSNPSKKSMYDNELMSYLRINPVSPPGFSPLNHPAGIFRETVNYQPLEINFQVMPQTQPPQPQQHAVMQPQPLRGMVPEPPPSMVVPQQNLSPQQFLHKPQPSQAQPQPTLPPLWQSPKQPQAPMAQQLRNESFLQGNNVTQNFPSNAGSSSRNDAVNNNNNNSSNNNTGAGADDDVNVRSEGREKVRGVDASSEDAVPSFWTACPYCYYMFEYPSVYEDCVLKCQHCRKAFQGIVIPSPPAIVDGQDVHFCCWGLMPLGVSMQVLERNKGRGGNWTPFSPMFNLPKGMGSNGAPGNWNNFGGWNVGNGNNNAGASGGGNVGGRKKSSGPRVYVDDEDVFLEYSESSEEDDGDWRTEAKKKKAKNERKANGVSAKTNGTPGRRGRKPKVDKGKNLEGGGGENVQQSCAVQEGVGAGVSNAPSAESGKKGSATIARRHSARVAKDFGKLDLNVEFNNEVEEPVHRVSQGSGAGRGEDDIIEGSGFFEGLDEFLSTLPILNVVGDDKVKAA